MLIGLIFLINLLVIGIAFILRGRGWRTAYIWIILVSISLIEWLLIILIPLENFKPLILSEWFSIGDTPVVLQFQVTNQNWPLVSSIMVSMAAFLLTGIARLNVRKDLYLWSVGITFSSIAFMAVLAGNLWSVVILWTTIDLLDIFYQLVMVENTDRVHLQRSLIIRFLGSLLLIFVIASISWFGINPALSDLTELGSIAFFVAAFLHSGVFPIQPQVDLQQNSLSEWILHILMKLLVLFVSFSILIYVPVPDLPLLINLIFSIIIYIAILSFGTYGISGREENFSGQWMFFIASFVAFLYINSGNLVFWLPALFLPSIFLLFYSHRNRSTILFPLFMILMSSGLPYTLNSFGTRSFLFSEFHLSIILLIIPLVFFLTNFLRMSIKEKEDFNQMESIYQILYLLGLLILVLSAGASSFKFLDSPRNELSFWWSGVITLLLTGALRFLLKDKKLKLPLISKLESTSITMQILSLDRLFNFGSKVEARLRNIAAGFSRLFEGAGGLLWALVLLVLILSILQ